MVGTLRRLCHQSVRLLPKLVSHVLYCFWRTSAPQACVNGLLYCLPIAIAVESRLALAYHYR
jgi:hypothetical protein